MKKIKKDIESVYARPGKCPTAKGFNIRKRVIGAIINAKENFDMAEENLACRNPSTRVERYKKSTLKCYWDEFNALSDPQKKRFDKLNEDQLHKICKDRKEQLETLDIITK